MKNVKMLELSNNHVSLKTGDWLDQQHREESKDVTVFCKSDIGWIVYANYHEEKVSEIPKDLLHVLDFAKTKGSDWVLLDHDIEIVDELPSYDW